MPTLWATNAEPQITVASSREAVPLNLFFMSITRENVPYSDLLVKSLCIFRKLCYNGGKLTFRRYIHV